MSTGSQMNKELVVFWFRRDLRMEDNTALNKALSSGMPVLPVFIFDTHIIEELAVDDARISFIYKQLKRIHRELTGFQSSLHIYRGEPIQVWKELLASFTIHAVYTNRDYEPYARKRDREIEDLLKSRGIPFFLSKDQVIFEEGEIVKKKTGSRTRFSHPINAGGWKDFKEVLHRKKEERPGGHSIRPPEPFQG